MLHLWSQSSNKATLNNRINIKPQEKFRVPVDNSFTHFTPNLINKPNALVPLDVGPICTKKGKILQSYKHPYEYEIENFTLTEWQCSYKNLIVPQPLEETELVYINSLKQLFDLVYDLKNEAEIAIDLEGHIKRTFQGLTCILQISTRSRDYIIDALELRDDLNVLNEIFTNPRILKVFHGSSSDILCLQRDFSLFVVNMFDTFEAAKYLKLETLSLQSLVNKFCNIELNKELQFKTDWRLRPLSPAHINYARQDTHYLLYIYDIQRNQLIRHNESSLHSLHTVYDNGRHNCKLIYTKRKPVNEVKFCKRFENLLNNQQLQVLKLLVQWREAFARENDESLDYVLPVSIMTEMAKRLPQNQQEVLDCCGPHVPRTVHQNKKLLLQIIREAVNRN